jgi:flagellar protein FliL
MAASAAPAETATEGGETPVKAGGGKKKLIIMAAAAVLVLGGGAGGYMYMQKGKADASSSAHVKKKTVFFDLPDITTNLASAPGAERPVYLRLKLALEVEDGKMVEEIKPLLPRVIDNFQIFLREIRPADLEGSAGLYRLKEELVRRINAAIYPARIEAVLFKDVLVQ